MRKLWRTTWTAGALAVLASGCVPALTELPQGPQVGGVAPPIELATPNPALIPTRDRELLWDQLVDVVDDYFGIEREERVRLVGNVLTEGRIDTRWELAPTILEPWREGSVGRYNRLEATFQTIRKRAAIRVIPSERGYLVDVTVLKEREALPRPVHPSAGEATFRNDNSLRDGDNRQLLELVPPPQAWTPLGRDIALEQKILLELQGRIGGYPGL
jgi:hypothetical protein